MNTSDSTPASNPDALLAVCLFAAFADGEKSDSERDEVRRLAEEFGSENLSALSRQILMRKLPLESVVADLRAPQDRLLAYEMALGVCEAGGSVTSDEQEFLNNLRRLLDLGEPESRAAEASVNALALAPIISPALPPTLPEAPDNGGMILKYSILNGALELLPETLATVAIIPLQMKMVYRIGQSHGVELDRSNIKDFLATAGLGLGSQMVEGFARKFMRGLGKKVGGKLAGRAADQITGSAFSFGSTYAIGQIAEKYYSSGSKMDAANVKSTFDSLSQKARELHAQYLPQIQARAQSLNPTEILSLVRGNSSI